MVMKSDFIQEDVELDDDWTPRRSAGAFQGGRSSGNDGFSFRLPKELTDFLRVMCKLAVSLGILVIAAKSLRPHGGVIDFLFWLCVLWGYGRQWMREKPWGSL